MLVLVLVLDLVQEMAVVQALEMVRQLVELFLHQMSLTSIVVTFLKGNDLDLKINSENVGGLPMELTTSGLNDVVV